MMLRKSPAREVHSPRPRSSREQRVPVMSVPSSGWWEQVSKETRQAIPRTKKGDP
jgi:hypothetical protein